MRKLVSLLSALALAACAQRPVADADPALWVVRDADTTVYLFGTVHALKPGLGWFDEEVKRAFDASGELVLEVVMPDAGAVQQVLDELGTGATPLAAQVPAEEMARLRAALPGVGLRSDAFDRFEPWLAATMLSSAPLAALGYDQREGAEAVLREAAEKAGKRVTGLETLRGQLGFFDALPLPAQRRLLSETLAGLPSQGRRIERAIGYWSKGDADGLASLVNEDLEDAAEVREALLVRRNRAWAQWIAARMARPGTVFVAVGAGHLAGAESVQAELARRGMTVERVRY